ncbi:Na+/H+ antiporter subunit E [Citricoccus nitrophenolicus]|uniref:Multisubunit sodium/proton antiporter MrpE subunit n=1 Tax=Citricoccus muralis TaxID=169134 RepID=A0A3D9LD64_9MICC|nr:Na+/H+ antiporter subunit E [Citricoccus muralis]REE04092.1 multisubunit sodium/proton antiporter MrpE subunit [Citricoccus muralis]
MSTGPDDQDGGRSFWSQWPILLGLTFTWGALWEDFSPGVLLAGVVFSMLTLSFYRLPRVNFSDRFNLWYALVFTFRFLWHVVTASISVAWDAITQGPKIVNSVVAVPLRSHDDLIVTLTGLALALVPGSLVIDVDRPSSTLFLHCLNVDNAEAVEGFRAEALSTEAAIIRAIGTKADLALVREDEARRADATAGRRLG